MTGLRFVLVPNLNRGEKGFSLPRSHCGEQWALTLFPRWPPGGTVDQGPLSTFLLTPPSSSLCSLADDESPGLYGFLHVIVHSAKGFKQSASKCPLNPRKKLSGPCPFFIASPYGPTM